MEHYYLLFHAHIRKFGSISYKTSECNINLEQNMDISYFYSMQQEGQLTSVQVHGYQKRYDPEKYYMYILRIQRKGQADPTYLFRSYKEFCEFYQKLCIHFPLAKVAR